MSGGWTNRIEGRPAVCRGMSPTDHRAVSRKAGRFAANCLALRPVREAGRWTRRWPTQGRSCTRSLWPA